MTTASGQARPRTPRLPRAVLFAAAVGLALVTAWIAWRPQRPAADKCWDVLLITLDTTRADRLGCYDYRSADTPTIDAVSRAGIRYDRCYCPAPITLPSHCSLLTGLTPPRHGIHDNGGRALSNRVETLAEILHRRGYETGAVIGAFVLDRQFGLAQGFDHYDDDMSRGTDPGRFYFAERNARLVTDAAIAWLQRDRSGPRFLWVHYFDPHAPYAPPDYDAAFPRQTPYDAEISFVDSQLKRLLEIVDGPGDRETLVLLTADHGEGLGEHGEPSHGLFTYNTTLRVPLMVRFPDGRGAGSVVSEPVSLTDVMPSILTWLSIACPAGIDGKPMPVSRDAAGAAEDEPRPIYFENHLVANVYRWCPLVGIVHGQAKLIQAPRPELYHLAVDPHEETNRFEAADPESKRMVDLLAALRSELAGKPAFEGHTIEATEQSLAKLNALGYVGGNDTGGSVGLEPVFDGPDPKQMLAVFHRIQTATAHIEQHRPAEAAEVLLDVVGKQDPDNRRAIRLLASLLEEPAESKARIITCLQAALRRTGNEHFDRYMLANLGLALMHEQRYREAIDVLNRLVQIEPKHAAALRHLGDAHQQIGETDLAVRSYERAVDLVETLTEPPDWLDQVRTKLDLLRKNRQE